MRDIQHIQLADPVGEEILSLQEEVIRQWLMNHYKVCNRKIMSPWPHPGECHWQLPAIIAKLAPFEIARLIRYVQGIDA